MITYFSLTLDRYEEVAPGIRHFYFSADHNVHFIPGQFIMLRWPTGEKKVNRNYSLANYGSYNPEKPKQIELVVSYVPNGFASERLFNMKPGDSLEAAGPFGRFTLPEKNESAQHYLLVATGTGIAPYRTMLSELRLRLKENPKLHISLLIGVRSPQNVLYKQEWLDFAAESRRFSVRIYYSRVSETQYPYENLGYVTQAIQNHVIQQPENEVAYLCGNSNMIDDVQKLLLEKGLSKTQIRKEQYYLSPKKLIIP